MLCACECGGEPRRGKFCPGHDQKLRARLEEMVGGLLNLADLVELARGYPDGKINLDYLGRRIKSILVEE